MLPLKSISVWIILVWVCLPHSSQGSDETQSWHLGFFGDTYCSNSAYKKDNVTTYPRHIINSVTTSTTLGSSVLVCGEKYRHAEPTVIEQAERELLKQLNRPGHKMTVIQIGGADALFCQDTIDRKTGQVWSCINHRLKPNLRTLINGLIGKKVHAVVARFNLRRDQKDWFDWVTKYYCYGCSAADFNTRKQQLAQMFEEICKEARYQDFLHCTDDIMRNLIRTDFSSDGLHPNAQGQKKIAQTILETVNLIIK